MFCAAARYYWFFLLMMSMMSALGIISSDLYLPAFPVIAKTLNVTAGQVQLTFSVFLLGMACAQLVYGPIADHFSRRSVVIAGTVIYVAASWASMEATSLTALLTARLFQAIGACGGSVVARAIISDCYPPHDAAKVYATIFPVIGMSPAVAPIVGGAMTMAWGWRSSFALCVGFGFILLVLIFFGLRETKSFAKVEESLSFVRRYLIVVRTRLFWGHVLAQGCAFCAYISYVVASPFIFHRIGLTPRDIGFCYINMAIGFFVGNILSKAWVDRYTINPLIVFGFFLSIIGSALMVGLGELFPDSVWGVLMPATLMAIGNGFVVPLGSAAAVGSVPKATGTASGLMGFFQLIFAAVLAGILGHVTHGSTMMMGCAIGSLVLVGLLIHLVLVVGWHRLTTVS